MGEGAQYARREVEDELEAKAREELGLGAGFKMSQATWNGDDVLELKFEEVDKVDEDADKARSY